MTDIRCVKCNGLLMKAEAVRGEIKCHKCHFINRVDIMFGFAFIQDPDLPKGEQWTVLDLKK